LLALASGNADWAVVRPPLEAMDVEAGRRLAEELARVFKFSAVAA
jgi:hypothetical protein